MVSCCGQDLPTSLPVHPVIHLCDTEQQSAICAAKPKMYRAALGPTSLKPFRLPRTILFLLLVAGRKPRPIPKSTAFPHKDDKLPFCLANLPSLWLFVPLHLLPSVFTGLQLFETLFSLAPCTQLRAHFSLTFSSLLGYGLYMPSFSTPHPFLMKTLVKFTYNKSKP